MHIENKRLLEGLQEAVDGLAVLSDTAQAKTLQYAAATMLRELRRRDDGTQLQDDYARGHEHGMRLAAAVAAAGTASAEGAALMAALPATIAAAVDFETSRAALERLRAALVTLIAEAGQEAIGAGVALALREIYAWEAGLVKLPAPLQIPPRTETDMRAVLERSARAQGGVFRHAEIVKCQPLHGGFGKSTTLFEARDDEGKVWPLVSRALRGFNLLGCQPGQDIGKEFHLVSYAFKRGIKAAEPLWLEDDLGKYGVRFFVSRQAQGRNIGNAVAAEAVTPAQARSLAIRLAEIHRLPFDATDADLTRSHIDATSGTRPLAAVTQAWLRNWVDFWYSLDAGAHPAMEAALQWLQANLPRDIDDVPVILHGDYGLHNILIDGDEVGAILDWESSHVGDRAEDLSWLLATLGKHVGREAFMSYYLEAGGRPVSRFQLLYYQVLAHVKMAMVTIETQMRYQAMPLGPHYTIIALGFDPHPLASLEGAIREAEAARE